MFQNGLTKTGMFFLGAAAGVALLAIMKTDAFKKGCTKLLTAGMQIKDQAEAFCETVKEDAQDIMAEVKAKRENAE